MALYKIEQHFIFFFLKQKIPYKNLGFWLLLKRTDNLASLGPQSHCVHLSALGNECDTTSLIYYNLSTPLSPCRCLLALFTSVGIFVCNFLKLNRNGQVN